MLCLACDAERKRVRNAADPSVARARVAAWHAADPARARAKGAKRRALLAGSVCAAASVAEINSLQMVCQQCGGPAEQLDHIVPISVWPCSNIHNLQWLCQPCNSSKSAKLDSAAFGCPLWQE